MEFRVLGPLEVRHAGAGVPLGGPRQRAVLAALLFRANEVVTPGYLAEAVWEAAPARPESNIRTYVAGLRERLRRAGADDSRLGTGAGGYQFRVLPGELDVETFHQLIDQAQRDRAAAEFARAAKWYQEALGLWRGKPLDGLRLGAGLWAEIAHLEERRLIAIEQYAEVRLALGEHDSVIGELRHLVIQHPLREDLWSRLMLALCGAGRMAEALQAFQQARRALLDELGTEPGSELQDLHQQILRKATPASSAPAPHAQLPAVPRQLPPDLRGFAGRADELRRLDAILDGSGEQDTAPTICALAGTAGVGKTALAVHWAHRVADRFPDGQLYVNLRGFDPGGPPVRPGRGGARLPGRARRAAARIPGRLTRRSALYRSLLAGRRMLVVLDNARDADQVRPLLPGTRLPGRGHQPRPARRAGRGRGRPPGHAGPALRRRRRGELLAAPARRRRGSAPSRTRPTRSSPGAPGCRWRWPSSPPAPPPTRVPAAALAAELRDAARPAGRARRRRPGHRRPRGVLLVVPGPRAPPAARLFRLLGLHPGPDIALPAAASLAGLPVAAGAPAAGRAGPRPPGRRARPGPVRAARPAARLRRRTGRARATPTAERRAAVRRLLDHYLHTAHAADRLLEPHRDPLASGDPPPDVVLTRLADPEQAMSWFRAERLSLLAAVDQASDAGLHRHAYQLAWTLVTFLDRQGHWHEYLSTQQAALRAAQQLGDRDGEARAHRFIGNALGRLGRGEDADRHLQRALALYADLGDLVGQARARRALCWSAGQRGDHADALRHSVHALELFRAAGHRTGEARALNAIGWYHAMLGEHRTALAECERALALHRELGSRDGEAERPGQHRICPPPARRPAAGGCLLSTVAGPAPRTRRPQRRGGSPDPPGRRVPRGR